jgi:hypothetical protein
MSKAVAQAVNTAPAEETMDELDEMETELTEATTAPATKAKKEKKEKAAKEPKISATQVGVAGLAEQLGTTGRELRMFLRKNFRDMTSDKGKTYVWDKDSKDVQAIIDAYKAKKAEPRKKAEKVTKADAAEEAPAQATSENLDDIDLSDIDG